MTGTLFVGLILFASVSGQCSHNWLGHGDSCYYFSHDTETWVDAKVLCKSVGANLATIQDAAENQFVQTHVHYGSSYKVNRAWIGLNDIFDEGTWIWDDTQFQLQGYNNWSPGEPSNDRDDENCAGVQDNGLWNDLPCHQSLHYVCEKSLEGIEIIG